MTNAKLLQTHDNTALVARQPIFNLKNHTVAYELLFRSPTPLPQICTTPDCATSNVILNGFNLMRASLNPTQRFFINFTTDLLEAGVAELLPPEICVIEILEDSIPTDKLLENLFILKKNGYTLALDDYTGQQHLQPFLDVVNIVKVNVLDTPKSRLPNLAALLRNKVTLLAEKVEDMAMAAHCRELGFALFQGFFFSRAEILRGKTISSSQLTQARLFTLATSQTPSHSEVVDIITADVSLTVKLLQYVNSVYFGLSVKVKTAKHAIAILGSKKLQHWLYVTALAGLNTAPLSKEVARLSAQRAKFLENLGSIKYIEPTPQQTEIRSQFFLLGLFSLLDQIMHLPFSVIAQNIPIHQQVLAALDSHTGPLMPWFTLMKEYEQGHWEGACQLAKELGIKEIDLAIAYADAAEWSNSFFS